MPPDLNESRPPEQWQSIDQWLDTPAFRDLMRDEFPEDAAEWLDPATRRQFLTLMGASAALAGVIGCNPSFRPASPRQVVPYVDQPTNLLPGIPLFFATAMPLAGGVGLGLLAKQTEGRPIKIEGNPNDPGSRGGTNVYAQGAILSLYDPDRSKEVLFKGQASTFDKAITALRDAIRKAPNKAAGVRVLTETNTSPTLARIIKDELKKVAPDVKWVQYEPLGRDNGRLAIRQSFGSDLTPVYSFDKAKVVLSLDSDFLSAGGPGDVRYARDFMSNRKVRAGKTALKAGDGVAVDAMNRLYAVEAMLTSTGAVADHRLPVKPSEVEAIARAVAAELGVAGVQPGTLPAGAAEWAKAVAADLKANAGKAAVIVGETQPVAVHRLGWAINQAIGANGAVVNFIPALETDPTDQAAEFKQLVADMAAGKVDTLVIAGVNPVFDAPADLKFTDALAKVKTSVHYGLHLDETGWRCTWHLPATHFLETWGDLLGYDGTVLLQQPLIAPLYSSPSLPELFARVIELPSSDPMELVRGTHAAKMKDALTDAVWQKSVRDGVLANSPPKAGPAPKAASLEGLPAPTPAPGGTEMQFRPDPTIYDGRFANNGWLQELPKPITKITWDNAAIMSPGMAAKLGLKNDFAMNGGEHGRTLADLAEFTVNGQKLTLPVFILPGHADDCVSVYLGYGRDRAGKVGTRTGFNAYAVRFAATPWVAKAEAKAAGGYYTLACTQGQYLMEGRRPVRSATVEQVKKHPEFAQITPASADEYKLLRANTPGTLEDFERLGLEHPLAHDFPHDHDHHDHKDGDKHDDHGHKHDPRLIPLSLYPQTPHKIGGQDTNVSYRRWGMAIDLGACTGCTTCVAACVAENNIPVVGKTEVTRGRAMHWIRVDRYFSIPGAEVMEDKLGDVGKKRLQPSERAEAVKRSAEIRTNFQPLPCMQCEKAPCEVVCPVGATVHSADGLNDMAYNRCVGTRYCSNNCPYKVRRFNFLQYADYTTESMKLVNNPEVTVRTRGVMEKCTYCVQRIRNAEIETEREWDRRPTDKVGRPHIKDGEVVTACQAACPTGAISFGDINDPASAVLRWKAEPTNYGLLAEINTAPRTSYLASVRNPNPNMPKGA